jgi:hypothetical protein
MNAAQKNRLTLVGLVVLFLTPVVVAIVLNSNLVHFVPDKTRNYGELVQPVVAITDALPPIEPNALRERWWLVYLDQADCPSECQSRLRTLHQLHLALGKEFDRIGITFIPSKAIEGLNLPPDVVHAAPPSPAWRAAIHRALGPNPRDGSLLVLDPLGNLMMRYPPNYNPSGVRRDLQILMKWSPLGKRS